MIMFPKVSVIIPAFNEEKYICRTLAAVIVQDYPDFEVIVVNNASTDRTESQVNLFLSKFRASQPNIIFCSEPRQGTNYARECGRRIASGEIIAQLDADCLPGKRWISAGVKQLHEPGVVAVTGPYDYFDGNLLMRAFTWLSQCLVYPAVNTMVQLAQRGGIIIGGNTFVKASVLRDCGGYNTAFTFYGDDVDIASRVSVRGWINYSGRLSLRSSSRRYKAIGFFSVMKKYQACFWDVIFRKTGNPAQTMEINHPR